jgi:outer membrane protein assembly factor BamB
MHQILYQLWLLLIAMLLAGTMPAAGAAAPPLSIILTNEGRIHGGVAMDFNGRVFFSTLYEGPSAPAALRCYDPAISQVRWNVALPGGNGGSSRIVPLVDSAGGRAFIANDLGWILAVRISDGVILWSNKCNG